MIDELITKNNVERRNVLECRNGLLNHLESFGAFCRWLDQPLSAPRYADGHWAPRYWQVRLPDGRLPDFIGKLETFGEDWERLRSRFPHLPELSHLNASQSPVPDVEREELRILRRYYREDFDAFGYD